MGWEVKDRYDSNHREKMIALMEDLGDNSWEKLAYALHDMMEHYSNRVNELQSELNVIKIFLKKK